MSRSADRMPVVVAEEVPFSLNRLLAAFCLLMGTLSQTVFGFGPIITVEAQSSGWNSDSKKMVTATCPAGMIAFSGGGDFIFPPDPTGAYYAVPAIVYSHHAWVPGTELRSYEA